MFRAWIFKNCASKYYLKITTENDIHFCSFHINLIKIRQEFIEHPIIFWKRCNFNEINIEINYSDKYFLYGHVFEFHEYFNYMLTWLFLFNRNTTGPQVCPELQTKVFHCYQANPDHTLECSAVVKAFAACVEKARQVCKYNCILLGNFIAKSV